MGVGDISAVKGTVIIIVRATIIVSFSLLRDSLIAREKETMIVLGPKIRL